MKLPRLPKGSTWGFLKTGLSEIDKVRAQFTNPRRQPYRVRHMVSWLRNSANFINDAQRSTSEE